MPIEENSDATRSRSCDAAVTTSDPELARLIAAWPELPQAVRGNILAAVEAALPVTTKNEQDGALLAAIRRMAPQVRARLAGLLEAYRRRKGESANS